MTLPRRKWTLLAPVVTAALAAGPVAGSAVAQTAASSGTGSVSAAAMSATGHPTGNATPAVSYYTPCYVTGTLGSVGCVHALITDIDAARAAEGVKPMVLPKDYSGENARRQLFVLSNLERVDRGLRPMSGIVASLDSIAIPAAADRTDPVLTTWTVGRVSVSSWGSNWAGVGNPLIADWMWMYEDGWGGSGSFNIDCTSASAPGCWGHRDNILGTYGGAPVLITGTGSATNSFTQLFAGGRNTPVTYLYTWQQALAAGADHS